MPRNGSRMKLAVFSKIGNQLPAADLCAALAEYG
jgi:hypothetical protein